MRQIQVAGLVVERNCRTDRLKIEQLRVISKYIAEMPYSTLSTEHCIRQLNHTTLVNMAIRTFLQYVPLALAAFREASAASITFNKTTTYQTIEGFGFSEAFRFGRSLMTMSNEPQRSVLDLLQSTERGAGLTILRNIVTSTNSDMVEALLSLNHHSRLMQP